MPGNLMLINRLEFMDAILGMEAEEIFSFLFYFCGGCLGNTDK